MDEVTLVKEIQLVDLTGFLMKDRQGSPDTSRGQRGQGIPQKLIAIRLSVAAPTWNPSTWVWTQKDQEFEASLSYKNK